MYNNNSKRKNKNNNSGAVETVLGEGVVFEGIISCEGSMKVEGELKGDIKVANSIVVGPNGSVTGDINAGEVIIFGKVTGKIDAGALEIKSTGAITGEVLTETLITEAGGAMMAKCEMKSPAPEDVKDKGPAPISSQTAKP
ncbi:MAG: polymer-forming cytoskeletal protein [Candidatus Dadabacteria bacterium]|nr:polymer-forming cytoskeletal protein [Candidatus Dadabacteria bacterium]MYE61009.1 polymer-forming cytoskeletal protein [Candidatus Dadabacteria bacterium]MYI73248.1 polymer-forming cytoskeletal protein [Candidatus Dadabacteria bacterium]